MGNNRPVKNQQGITFFRIWGNLILMGGFLFSCSSPPGLKWNNEKHYRWAEVDPGYFGSPGFEQLSPSQTNIHFINQITEKEIAENRHYLNGSGVAAGDIDGDGRVDLYFAGLSGPNRLYKNLGGMRFEDITSEAGVAHEGYYSTGAVFADVNGDTHLDLLVTSMHKENVLYINDGNGKFTLKEDSGLGPAKGSMTMALADIDGDRDLDLYIVNYKEKSVKDIYSAEELAWKNILREQPDQKSDTYTLIPPFDQHYQTFVTESHMLAGVAETGEVDELYINEGGTFQKVPDTRSVFLNTQGEPYGLQPDWGLTAKFQDLNRDRLPDLYVCNDFWTPDRIWINQGGGIFRAMDRIAIRNLSYSSMAVDFSDINRDGLLDIFVTEMLSPVHHRQLQQLGTNDPTPNRSGQIKSRPQYNRNSLYLKGEDGTYVEISYLSGVEATGWSWATRFMDINLDGYEDLIINTGYTYDILDIDTQIEMMRAGFNVNEHFGELIHRAPPLELSNRMLMNNGDLTFRDRSSEWGFTEPDVSHGMATADLDRDGDLDIVSNRLQKTAVVYENTGNAPRIAVRLIGNAPNTQAIGAKVTLSGGPAPQRDEITAGGGYLSGSGLLVVFAANEDNPGHVITVTWPDGRQSIIDSVKASRIYEINQTAIDISNVKRSAASLSPARSLSEAALRFTFKDISGRINHHHHENFFNDFDLQSLLPGKLSQLGPGVTWIDIDRDQDDDLFIATGKGGTLGAFENLGGASFRPFEIPPFNKKVLGDQTSIIGWGTGQGINLLVGRANYEQGDPRAPSVFQYRFKNLQVVKVDSIQGFYPTTGPLAAADYDGDGNLDLFVGSRFIPAHYPQNATSRFFINKQGTFVPDQINSGKLREIGLITGSVFTDYDRDGDQDLLLSREWDSIILLENKNGIFNDVSDSAGLADYKGWWNGIATGDFNNDGYPDIVATNRGLNSTYQLEGNRPLRMYYDDFNHDGGIDIIETYAYGDGTAYVPRKRLYAFNSLPVIVNRMRSYEQFAHSTLKDIFGDRLSRIPYKEINTLKHMLFINTGKGFKAHPLPVEAQFSAAFYAGVADFDNDGNEDLFLSQNFFGLPRQVPRLDAGRGLWLRGDGKGNFSPVPASKSGIRIYGEQRGAALSDFNRDGKVDLAVSQNGAATKLYLNQTPKTGIRIHLKGPAENTTSIGSAIRLVYTDGSKGPLREIQVGSGYWSQNSVTQVIGASAEVKGIEITWFDGTRQTVDAIKGRKDYVISYTGDGR